MLAYLTPDDRAKPIPALDTLARKRVWSEIEVTTLQGHVTTSFGEFCDRVKRRIKPRIPIQNLLKLGIRKDEAVTYSVSSKGPWVMSSSQAVHEALSLAGPAAQARSQNSLKGQGLANLFTIWQKLTARR